MLAALGITPGEIEEARKEAARLRGDPKNLCDGVETTDDAAVDTANT